MNIITYSMKRLKINERGFVEDNCLKISGGII